MTTLLTSHEDLVIREPAPEPRVPGGARPSFWALVERSDEALLEFDTELLDHDDIEHARVLLAREPTIFRNHLTIAKFLDGWIERVVTQATPSEFIDGFIEGLVEMATHLRDGDFADDVGATTTTPSEASASAAR